jgi:hypothetical protein
MKRILFYLAVLPMVFYGCSNNDEPDVISLKVSEKTLYHEDEYQIEATSKAAITYSSENEYHAMVSETGLVTAKFVGETNVLLSNSGETKSFKVIVKPKSNLYPEPEVKFGDSKSSIITKFGTPGTETSSGVAYSNYSNSAPILMFLFDSSNKLTSYAIMVKSAYSSVLADFLLERYLAVSEKDGTFLFINGLNANTATMIIGIELYNISYWRAIYVPNTPNKSASLKSGKDIDVASQFDELLKRIQ